MPRDGAIPAERKKLLQEVVDKFHLLSREGGKVAQAFNVGEVVSGPQMAFIAIAVQTSDFQSLPREVDAAVIQTVVVRTKSATSRIITKILHRIVLRLGYFYGSTVDAIAIIVCIVVFIDLSWGEWPVVMLFVWSKSIAVWHTIVAHEHIPHMARSRLTGFSGAVIVHWCAAPCNVDSYRWHVFSLFA